MTIRVTQDDASIEIEVRDTGPGIAPEFLPHVFERFRQADGSTTRTHGGLGLGLAIVRHLVELHGGVIGAENASAGAGAIFTVKLPLASYDLMPEAGTSGQSASEQQSNVELEDLKILVVEDEIDTLDLLTVDLTTHGARVRGVASADEALELLDADRFDLLISDIGIAGTDGYDLIEQVREREAKHEEHIPAVALTAYARAQERIRAIAAGYNTHVAKPVDIRELIAVVKCLTGKMA